MNFLYTKLGKRNVGIIALVLLAIGFAYLLYLPADHFDQGQSICLSVLLADTKCYACGMTRGIHHLIHGEFAAAWEFNKLTFIVLPLALYMIVSSLYKMIFLEDKNELQS